MFVSLGAVFWPRWIATAVRKQSDWWKRQAKSLVPLHPTEDEEDIEAEEPLDACIRDAKDRLNDFMDKKSAE
jgi:hypothetical protein